MPFLLPGVDVAAPAEGTAPRELPDGALLRPALPPHDNAFLFGRHEMSIAGLRVGSGRISMGVSVDPDGVQVELAHLGGEPVRVAVLLPEPRNFAIRVAYVDWFRQDEVGVPLEVELAPGEEPRVLFGRFAPRSSPWTRELPADLPAGLARDGLRLDYGALGDDERTQLAGLDAALAQLLGARVEVVAPSAAESRPAFAGISVQLEPETWRRELAAILSSVERFTLRSPPRGN